MANRVKTAVINTPTRYTISEVANTAMLRAAKLLEHQYHQGLPFPPRPTERLKGGRPPQLLDAPPKRMPMTVVVDSGNLDRLKNAIYYSPTKETMAHVMTVALSRAARYLEKKRMTDLNQKRKK